MKQYFGLNRIWIGLQIIRNKFEILKAKRNVFRWGGAHEFVGRFESIEPELTFSVRNHRNICAPKFVLPICDELDYSAAFDRANRSRHY